MTKILSQDEFEYQTMCGSTNDAFVYGLGHVQWQTTFVVSYRPDTMGHMLPNDARHNSTYLLPKKEMTTAFTDEYRQAFANEIKRTITNGTSVWDPVSGEVKALSPHASVDVSLSGSDVVTISVRDGADNYTRTLDMDSLLISIANPTFHAGSGSSGDVSITNTELGGWQMKNRISNADFIIYATNARKLSGMLMTVYIPFQETMNKLNLYTRIAAPGGTKLLHPFARYKYPNWSPLGRNAGRMIFPKIGIELSNSTIMSTTRWLGIAAKRLGVLGVGLGFGDILFNGEITWTNGLHTVMAVCALNAYTAPVAFVYFTTDAILQLSTDKGVGNYIDDSFRGKSRGDQARTLLQYTTGIGLVINICDIIQINKNIQKQ